MAESTDTYPSGSHPSGSHGSGSARRIRLIVAFAVNGVAVALRVARANRNSMVYYVTGTELLGQDASSQRGLRVTGKVVPGTIDRKDLQLRFEMTDGEKALPVVYRGVVPDTFGEDGEVVVEGKYIPGGPFEASFLMAKCPSKYEASPEQQHPSDIPMNGVKGT